MNECDSLDSPTRWKMKKEDEDRKLKLNGNMEIDFQKMGGQERKMLIDNLLARDDHENFLRRIRQRFDM